MFTRTLALSVVLCVLGSTAAAQLHIVQQTRSVSGSADADAPGGIILYDSFSDSAPHAGPYTVTRSAQVNGAWGGASADANQTSVLGGHAFSGTGGASASASVPFSADQGLATASSRSDVHVTFDVLVPLTYSVAGLVSRVGDSVSPSVALRQGTTMLFSFSAQGSIGSWPFQASGVLAPGTYDFFAHAGGSAYANMFYSLNYYSNFEFTFAVEDPAHVPYCFGDGTGTACPCVNHAPAGSNAGCLNSTGAGGMLRAYGTASLSNDTLVLEGSQMTNNSVLYFQGTQQHTGGNGAVFGDGKLCVSGSIARLGRPANSNGASAYPTAGDASISSRGSVTAPGTRTYQVWYRNGGTFCTPQFHNMTNAVEIVWGS